MNGIGLAQVKRLRRAPRTRTHAGVSWLSIPEAARRLGVTVSLLYRLVREAQLRAALLPPRAGARPVRYLAERDVVAYARRRDRWLRQHGRKLPRVG